MSKPLILALEDTPSRIKWLRIVFPDCDIDWSDNVQAFLVKRQDAELSGILRVILLDHDLGISDWEIPGYNGTDDDGLNGYDAACALETNIPVIVWSINDRRAPPMVDALRARGMSCDWYPFNDATSLQILETAIRRILEET